ncbi:hypothetical protein LSH36_772g01075 [Paralvinella palmiformis]|uniref:Uncharacterized protein n=1 Tax=Paralvinella palmiformis TaxID=53620 RepID=A0AAD9J265_9ANNE|nr:hypothetical protein LSH36_772g01075 [Paralvinella palmiformis]
MPQIIKIKDPKFGQELHIAQAAVNSRIENPNVKKTGTYALAAASAEIADMDEGIISITDKDSDKKEPMELTDNKIIKEFPDFSGVTTLSPRVGNKGEEPIVAKPAGNSATTEEQSNKMWADETADRGSYFNGYHGWSGYPLTQRDQAGSNRRYSSNNGSHQWQHVDRRRDDDDFSVRNRYGEEDVPSTWSHESTYRVPHRRFDDYGSRLY